MSSSSFCGITYCLCMYIHLDLEFGTFRLLPFAYCFLSGVGAYYVNRKLPDTYSVCSIHKEH